MIDLFKFSPYLIVLWTLLCHVGVVWATWPKETLPQHKGKNIARIIVAMCANTLVTLGTTILVLEAYS